MEQKHTLYEITTKMKELEDLMIQAGGDVTTTEGQNLEKWLQEYEWLQKDKVDGYIKAYRNREGDIAMLDAEIKRLKARKTTLENEEKGMEFLVKRALTLLGVRKFQGTMGSLRLQAPGGKKAVILLVEDEKVPDEFCQTVKVPDMKLINAALEADENDPRLKGIAGLKEKQDIVVIG